jgi:hypothetical protein
MPELTVTEDQLTYIEELREELAADTGPYAHVRPRDALQYLIDAHDGDVGATDVETNDETGANEESATEPDESADSDDADRLSSMMSLLDEHDGKWRRTESDDGTYEVDLPDGGTETVRTKDDVRAVLFKNY